MPSREHEDIIDEVSRVIVNEYSHKFQPTFCGIGFMASFFVGYGLERNKPPAPDLAIILPDGFGAMAIEVGRMEDGKWQEVIDTDGDSIRVLRIGFDRSVSIIRPRNTAPEVELIKLLSARLASFTQTKRRAGR